MAQGMDARQNTSQNTIIMSEFKTNVIMHFPENVLHTVHLFMTVRMMHFSQKRHRTSTETYRRDKLFGLTKREVKCDTDQRRNYGSIQHKYKIYRLQLICWLETQLDIKKKKLAPWVWHHWLKFTWILVIWLKTTWYLLQTNVKKLYDCRFE